MSDFYGCLESTSFRVKDATAFLADAEVKRLLEYARDNGFFDHTGDYFAFGWYGQYPSPIITMEEGETENVELDIREAIQRHILPGDVCQLGVSGNEKLRYIGGGIWWVTSGGCLYFDVTTDWHTRLTEESLADNIEELANVASEVLES